LLKPSDVIEYFNKLIRGFDSLNSSRNSFLAIPDHIKSIDIENEISSDKKFESIFVSREYMESEIVELKLFLRGQILKFPEKKLLESKSLSPKSMNTSKFHLFYHQNSFNNNKYLYAEYNDFKSLTYKEAYDIMVASIGRQLQPIKFKFGNFIKN
jgi:hypothetical protein